MNKACEQGNHITHIGGNTCVECGQTIRIEE
jgi:hypothetical protein